MAFSSFSYREDNKGTACIGCRLRRKKCDKKSPLCTGCSDLQIPRELCIYRKMGLASKDSKATLAKEKKKNRELKDDLSRTMAIYNYNKKSTGVPHDYFYLKGAKKDMSYKQFQLNPEKNPLLCTVMTAPQTSAYLGSISVAAITEAEPQMKLLLQQIHKVIMKEKLLYERKISSEAPDMEKEIVVSTFNEHCRAALVGMSGIDGDQTILELIHDIELHFPSKTTSEFLLQAFFRQNHNRWTLYPYMDEESFRRSFSDVVRYHENGKVSFNINLERQPERIIFIARALVVLSLASFCFGQSTTEFKELDSVLYAKYAHALTRIDVLGRQIRLGEQAIGPDYIAVVFSLLLLEKYTASAGFMESLDQICEPTLSIRLLIMMAMTIKLHKDLDKYYPSVSPGEKRAMKSLWYTLVLYESFESMDVGFISKFEPPTMRRHDYCYNYLIESIHVIHSVVYNYNMIDDMGKVEDLIEFIDTNLIERLKKLLKEEFRPMAEEMQILQTYNFDDTSLENLKEYDLITQGLAMRYLILAMILALYHICFKRLEQIGQGDTEKCKRFRILGWKYSLTIETLFREMWIGFNRIGNHKNYFDFHPVSALLGMAPILRFAQRRVTLFATSRFLYMLNVDEHLIVNYVLYGRDNQDAGILDDLKTSGELDKLFTIADFDDMDVDGDYEKLVAKFGDLNSVRFLVVSLSKVMSDTLALMHTGQSTFNFLKLSKIFHVLLLRLCSFLLSYTVKDSDNSGPEDHAQDNRIQDVRTPSDDELPSVNTGTPQPERRFDFRNFFTTGQDVTVDEEEIVQLFNMTTRNRFT